jgi:hypothetical protein
MKEARGRGGPPGTHVALLLLALAAGAQEAKPLTRAGVLAEATKVAAMIPSTDARAVVTADIALELRKDDPAKGEALLAEAAFAATTEPYNFERALALQAVARRVQTVDPQWAADMLLEATKLVEEIEFPNQRSLVLMQIGTAKAAANAEDARGLLEEAVVQARDIQEPQARVAALRDLSAAFAAVDEATAQALFDEAMQAAEGLPPGAERDLSLADLAGFITQRSVQQAVQLIDTIAEPAAKSQALHEAVLAFPLSEAEPARELARSIPDEFTRIGTLADLALRVAETNPETARQAAEEAGTLAAALADPDMRNESQAAAAAAWAGLDADRALADAGRIADTYFADVARSRIALYLVPRAPQRALEIARSIERGVLQAEPLAALVPQLAATDPAQAYALASEIRTRRAWAEALLAVATRLRVASPGEAP